jgi:hypothetical protein
VFPEFEVEEGRNNEVQVEVLSDKMMAIRTEEVRRMQRLVKGNRTAATYIPSTPRAVLPNPSIPLRGRPRSWNGEI